MKSLVGIALGVGFFGAVISLLFGIDFFKTKNPFVAIVMAVIGLAVILLMFTYIWGML
jgi:asparagine N-glycosylation enzyme membrane subunit Stt3